MQTNLSKLLRQSNVSSADLDCQMIGMTRSGACRFRATAKQVALLVRGLNLQEVRLGPKVEKESAQYALWVRESGCPEALASTEGQVVKVYKSERRAQSLRLGDGQAFEYLLLTHNLEKDEICVQVSYAYG